MNAVGYFSKEVIDALGLNLAAGLPILIGDSNIEHIKQRHPYEYSKYFRELANILSEPDYVGRNPKDGSIAFVKEYLVNSEYIRVAVRISPSNKCYVKTLHLLSTYNAERYIKKGTLIKLDKR